MDGNFEEQVRQRAYEIWVGLGYADGQAHDHWIAAERDLMAEAPKPKRVRAAGAKTRTVAPKTVKAKTAKATPAKTPPAKATRPRKSANAAEANGASA